MIVRALVRRDGPGEWSYTIVDDHSELLTGVTVSHGSALDAALDELRLLDEADQPPGCEIPFVDIVNSRTSDSCAVRRSPLGPDEAPWRLRGPITPGDATVPPGNRLYDSRPPWRRWLGLS